MYKKYLKLIPLALILLINSCNGGGSTDSNGKPTPNPPPAPLPEPGKITYALIAVTGKNKIMSVPLDINGNPLWDKEVFTGKDNKGNLIPWETPYYILVSDDNKHAYISNAPLNADGSVYECTLNQDATLSNCAPILTNLNRPVSMALLGKYLYVTNQNKDKSSSGGAISSCNLTTKDCSEQPVTRSNLSPAGVAVSDTQMYITYGCLHDEKCNKVNSAMYSYNLNSATGTASGGVVRPSNQLSNPTDLTLNNNYLYISNFLTNNVAQYSTDFQSGGVISTIFHGNFEISLNTSKTFAYIINGVTQKNGIKGYISKCTVKSNGLLDNNCTTITAPSLVEPYGIAITGELQGS